MSHRSFVLKFVTNYHLDLYYDVSFVSALDHIHKNFLLTDEKLKQSGNMDIRAVKYYYTGTSLLSYLVTFIYNLNYQKLPAKWVSPGQGFECTLGSLQNSSRSSWLKRKNGKLLHNLLIILRTIVSHHSHLYKILEIKLPLKLSPIKVNDVFLKTLWSTT